jgi:hypothetical protein
MTTKNTIYKQKSKLDQFYTSDSTAQFCYDKLNQELNLNDFTLFLEPSAGTGSFLKLMPEELRLGIDLDPKFNDVIELDFFDFLAPSDKKNNYNWQSTVR